MNEPQILIVDDDRATTGIYRQILREAGMEPVIAGSQDEAHEILATSRPVDLILVDQSLHGLECTQFVVDLRRRYPHLSPATPIVILSGHHAEGPIAQKVRRDGGVYFEKPSDIDDFVSLVSGLLSDPHPRR